MSSRKRSYPYGGATSGNVKQRSVGGRTLTYRASAPVYGSSRYRASLGPVARQAMRTDGWANPSSGAELKFKDTNFTTTINANSEVWSPGTPTLLNGLANGSDASTRIGRKIIMTSLYFRTVVQLATTSTGGAAFRIVVVYDKQSNAAAPAVTDVFVADNFRSPNNLSNRDRFVTLCDVVTDQIGTGTNYSGNVTIYKKINLETMFNAGSAGTIGDISSGSIYFFVAQSGGILTANPTVNTYARIRYTDM